MAELKSPSDNTASARLSQEEIQMPLSPVLGTGQSLKKILQNRKGRQKRGSNRIAQKLENVMIIQDEADELGNSIKLESSVLPLKDDSMLTDFKELDKSTPKKNCIPGPSKRRLSLEYNPQDLPQNSLDRIKILEELEIKKRSVINAFSFSKTVSRDTSKPVFAKCVDHLGQDTTEYDNKCNSNELCEKYSREQKTDLFLKEVNTPAHFQTATGRDIYLPETNIKTSAKLFDDILYPSLNQSSRKNKFNYLRKYGSLEDCASQNEIRSTTKCKSSSESLVNIYKGRKSNVTQNDEIESSKSTSKSICKGGDFDNLSLLQNSDLASVKGIELKKQINASLEQPLRTPGKNIFDGEDFSDLKLIEDGSFGTALKILSNEAINRKSDKCLEQISVQESAKKIFDGYNFGDLKHNGFKSASESLEINQNVLKEGKKIKNLVLPPKSSLDKASKCVGNGVTNHKPESGKILQKGPLGKIVTNIFENENFNDLKLSPTSSFKPASMLRNDKCTAELQHRPQQKSLKNILDGRNFKILYNTGGQSDSIDLKPQSNVNNATDKLVDLSASSKLTKNVFEGENFSDLNFIDNIGFKCASVPLNNMANCTERDAQMMENTLGSFDKPAIPMPGCKRALLSEMNSQEPLAKKPFRNIFENENFDDLNVKGFQNLKCSPGTLKPSNSAIATLNNKPKGFRNIFEGENFDDLNLGALSTKFRSPLVMSKKNLQNHTFESPYKTLNKTISEIPQDDEFCGFSNEEKENSLNICESNCDIVAIIENRFKVIKSQQNPAKPLINLSDISDLSKELHSNKLKINLECDVTNKGRLGKKRKFSDLDSDQNSLRLQDQNKITSSVNTPLQNSSLKRPRKRLGCHFSPTIQISETVLKRAKRLFEDVEHTPIETSTPVKFDKSLAASLVCNLTPVQGVTKKLGGSFLDAARRDGVSRSFTLDRTLTKNNARFGLNRPSEGDVRAWMDKLSCERRFLEDMLRVVDEKQTILANQRTILDFSGKGKTRISPGFLSNSKSRTNRVSLRNLSSNTQREDNFLNQVNPQNAHLVHFYMEDKRQSYVQTTDGATVVPTPEGRIGLSEIGHSFKVMDGVDPNLIPKGWIQNHYKWIIWKLASYERMFSDEFDGCLCIENVIQQLKYRYDIEIDRVKRSALHKIFEKDDCPQRRLVLCVSKIIKVNNTYELELTDGWYPIRTVIDPLLCDQILKGKIKLGVKLMTYGAEIVNCDGCHPLEATDQVYLKINYNCTRRTVWWTKLGCQKDSGPFLIPLASVNSIGGNIGCIKCFILRSYPVKYMEKCGNVNVWRNRKAEERREQEFYNENIRVLETRNNRNNVYSDSKKDVLKSIRSVDDPEILYNILQKSSDPEIIQENLSDTQKTLLYNYAINKSAQNQGSTINQFDNAANKLQDRCVTSLLRIKIIDASCDSDDVHEFHVWRPQDSHVEELTEGKVVTMFNVSCSLKWGLSANRTTRFKREDKPKDERYQKFRRKVTPLEEIQNFSKGNEILPEFDTVGVVVEKRIGDHQQVWLTDSKKNLLLIKIYDSPKNILLLDAVNEGQIITACNLVFKNFSQQYSFAVADHFVIFSRYSQYRHLQKASETLEEELETEELSSLLEECKNKIFKTESKWGCRSPMQPDDTDDMDCSQITTTDLALLECVDKLT